MRGMRERLERDLSQAVNRLRQMGGVALEELPGPAGDNSPFADEVDEIVASEEREIMFGTRELLVDRVNRITAALDRLSTGEYGTCVECGEAIAPARLRALPEVQTCVRCQDRIERLGRRMRVATVEAGVDEDYDRSAAIACQRGRVASRPLCCVPGA
jgi:DnaK suppressor protein